MIRYYSDKTTPIGQLLEHIIQQFSDATGSFPQQQDLAIQFTHLQYYLPDQSPIELLALLSVHVTQTAQVHIEGSIFPFTPERLAQIQQMADEQSDTANALRDCCANLSLPWLQISEPWLLVPVHIPKPWGQEIWYTGIEARGQAQVAADNGNIPLPWLLELMSAKMGMSPTDQPVLLKVLDPVADEVYGDLYFELHQEKQEVYVVTHVDQGAWPEGIGAIQLGFASQVRKLYKSDDEFKLAYLSAVKEYEAVRRQVDFLLDQKKTAAALDPQTPASSLQLIEWINELSQHSENKELIKQEHRLRHIMNSFVERHPLMLGDVVTVPKLVPHALQHGVRVVEFQTPVYERKILSFGQKVLTQTHWDTEVALELVDFEFAQLKPAELVLSTPQMLIERIVNFDDFEVQRIQLAGSYKIQGHRYWVLMVLSGQLKLGELQGAENIRAGQALLIPGSGEERLITSSDPCIFLLATPR